MASPARIQDWSANMDKAAQLLRNPSAVSAIASLGLHGLFFLALPLLPYAALKATEPEIREPVEMVELTPAEQSRLPDFSVPQIELPPIAEAPPAADSDLFTLPPLPQIPSSSPGNTDSDSSFFAPPPLPLFIPSLPPPSRIPFSLPDLNRTPSTATRPSPSPQTTPSPSPSPTQAETQNPARNPSDVAANSASPTPTESPSPNAEASPSPTVQSQQEILQARVDEIRERRQQLAQRRQAEQLYAYDATGTTREEATGRYAEWSTVAVDWIGEERDFDDSIQLLRLTGAYPETACTGKFAGGAIVGVLVNGEGKITPQPGPALLQSSGYRPFNEIALETAKSYEFEATGKKEAYQMVIKFEPSSEDCPAQPETQPETQPEAQGEAQG